MLRRLLSVSLAAPVLATVVAASAGAAEPPAPGLRDAAAESGLVATHRTGRTGEYHMPEISCGGAALLDADGDGDLDVYFVQSARRPGDGDRLYRNDGPDAAGRPRFVDRSAGSALPETGYGCGVASGDVDGDGLPELLVTGADGARLLANRGGRFVDATATAALVAPGWSSSASFLDHDADGDLDLWIARYLDLSAEAPKVCLSGGGARDYCHPDSYPGTPDLLFENRGDGTFRDVSAAAGIDRVAGKSLGVVAADLDDDGRLDVYVANDGEPNHLWLQREPGRFRDEALESGSGVDARGRPEASMGVVAEDLDGDGRTDLFLSHLTGETHTLYRNEAPGFFVDITAAAGLGAVTFAATGWGVAAFDPDRDGDLDLWVGNGAVRAIEARLDAGDPFPFRQPDQLFRNLGGGRFAEWPDPVTAPELVTRGIATGDLEGDGDHDLVLVHAEGPLRLLLAEAPAARHWLGVEPRHGASVAVGSRVTVTPPGGRPLVRHSHADGSYGSAGDPRVLVGLGDATGATIAVAWPGGAVTRWEGLPADRYHRLSTAPGDRRR